MTAGAVSTHPAATATTVLLASAPERWYVRSGNIEPVRDLCSRK